jgi:translation initiation factor 4G
MGGRDVPPPPGRFGGPANQDEARLMGRGEVARPLRGAAMERQASAEVSLRPSSLLAGKR